MKRLIFAILGVLIFCGLSAQEIPQKISYQGKLLEGGVPVSGTKSIKFTIGSWSETHSSVQITDGLYSVKLGETTPIPTSIFDNSSSLNLQISIEGTNLTSTDILSVPYAYKAEKAVEAENVPTDNSELTNGAGYITSPNDADADPANEFNTSASLNGTDLEITDAGGTKTVDLSSIEFSLPYNDTYTGNNKYAIYISNEGTGGVAEFYVPDGGATALYVNTDGTGKAAIFKSDASNANHAVAIEAWSNNVEALSVENDGSAGAAYFYGNVDINGNLSKSSGTFKIDHPLDPENKYLYHSFVESPDMMNVYNGNIVLNKKGEAIVDLPDWFEVLNKDFRYQLTCIGGFSPVYISEKIFNNKFKISGGIQGMEISWQITGIRQDPYANQNRIQVEVEKPEKEKGHYLHFKEYNQPIEKSIKALKNPEMLEELKERKEE